jgi:hypothetical protein
MHLFAIRFLSPATTQRSPYLFSFVRVLAVLIALASTLTLAQVTTGTILGTVTDPSGAVIPGAKVTVTNTDTGISTNVVSKGGGNYEVPYLVNGTYSVKVEAAGFSSFEVTSIVLNIGDEHRVTRASSS